MSEPDIVQSCTECNRINCNGIAHRTSAIFLYPVCDICGIELCDLIELLENPSLRDEEECEICQFPYHNSAANFKNHFASHFQQENDEPDRKLYCINCVDETDCLKSTSDSECFQLDDEQQEKSFKRKEIEYVEDDTNSSKSLSNNELDQIGESTVSGKSKKRKKIDNNIEYTFKEYSSEDGEEQAEGEEIEEYITTKPADIRRFKCSQCQRAYGTSLELMFHKNNFHNTPAPSEYDCPLCDQTFPSKNSRAVHVNAVHRNPDTNLISCPYCDKEIKNVCIMEDHVLIHNDKLPFICDICGKGFRRLGNLQGHYATHNAEDSYTCFYCTKTFKTDQLRKKHIRHVHVEDKPLKCEQCDKRYKDHSDLRRHRWTHGGFEKKFVCTLCDRKFFENKCLRIHMKIHSKRRKGPEFYDVNEPAVKKEKVGDYYGNKGFMY